MSRLKIFKRSCSEKRNRCKRAGFTLAELLIVVAIITILAALGFVAVIRYQRNLKVLEDDGVAEEIFMAAQNHLIASQATGEWKSYYEQQTKRTGASNTENTGLGSVMPAKPADMSDADWNENVSSWSADGTPLASDGTEAKHDYRYLLVNNDSSADTKLKADTMSGRSGDSPTSALAYILPYGATDESVRSGGSYIIEYDAMSGAIYAVFYTDGTRGSFGGDSRSYFTKAIYTSVLNTDGGTSQSEGRGDEGKSTRRDTGIQEDGKSKAVYGYYGGATAEGTNVNNPAPVLSVRNAENLVLTIVDPNYGGKTNNGQAVETNKHYSIIDLTVTGNISQASVTEKLYVSLDGKTLNEGRTYDDTATANSDNSSYFNSSWMAVPFSSTQNVTINGTTYKPLVYYVTLDSDTIANGHFCNIYTTGTDSEGNTKNFIPGEDITITVKSTATANGGGTAEASVTTNSLFESVRQVKGEKIDKDASGSSNFTEVSVSNARHLMNLSTYISKVSDPSCSNESEKEDKDKTDIVRPEKVSITRDIWWQDNSPSPDGTVITKSGAGAGIQSFVAAVQSNAVGGKDNTKPRTSSDKENIKIYLAANNGSQNAYGYSNVGDKTKYVGVVNSNINSFDGNNHILANFDMTVPYNESTDAAKGNVGIFSAVRSGDDNHKSFSLYNLELLNPSVDVSYISKGSENHDNGGKTDGAGALIGSVLLGDGNLHIENVFIHTADRPDRESDEAAAAYYSVAEDAHPYISVKGNYNAGGAIGYLQLTGDKAGQSILSNIEYDGGERGLVQTLHNDSSAGGLIGSIGRNKNNSVCKLQIQDSSTTTYVANRAASGGRAGGFIGLIYQGTETLEITRCYYGGRTTDAGVYGDGIEGPDSDDKFAKGDFNIVNVGEDTSDHITSAGGFIGTTQGDRAKISVHECYTTGSVYSANGAAGGFVGKASGAKNSGNGPLLLKNSYATGRVDNAETKDNAGYKSDILRTSTIGSFVGRDALNSESSNNYYLRGINGSLRAGDNRANTEHTANSGSNILNNDGTTIVSGVYIGTYPFTVTDEKTAYPYADSIGEDYPFCFVTQFQNVTNLFSPLTAKNTDLAAHVGDWPVPDAETMLRIENGNTLTAIVGFPIGTLGQKNGEVQYLTLAVHGNTSNKTEYALFQITNTTGGTNPEDYSVQLVNPLDSSLTPAGGAKQLPASWTETSDTDKLGGATNIFAGNSTLKKASSKDSSALSLRGSLPSEAPDDNSKPTHSGTPSSDSYDNGYYVYQYADASLNNGTAVSVTEDDEFYYVEIALDNITREGCNFASLFPDLTPGEDVTVYAAGGLKTWAALCEGTTTGANGTPMTAADIAAGTNSDYGKGAVRETILEETSTAQGGSYLKSEYYFASSMTGNYAVTNSLFADGSNAADYPDNSTYTAQAVTTDMGSGSNSSSGIIFTGTELTTQNSVDDVYHLGTYRENTGVLTYSENESSTAYRVHVTTGGRSSLGAGTAANVSSDFSNVAILMNGRHLQNLENTVSGVNGTGNATMFTAAELHNDILWADYEDYSGDAFNNTESKDYKTAAEYTNVADYKAETQRVQDAGLIAFINGSVKTDNSGVDTSNAAAGSRTQIHLYTNDTSGYQPEKGRFLTIINNPGIARFDGGTFYGMDSDTDKPLYRHTIYNLAEGIGSSVDAQHCNVGLFGRIDTHVSSFRMTSLILKNPVSITSNTSNVTDSSKISDAGLLIGYRAQEESGTPVTVTTQIDNILVASDKDITVTGSRDAGGLVGGIGLLTHTSGSASIWNIEIDMPDCELKVHSTGSSGGNTGSGNAGGLIGTADVNGLTAGFVTENGSSNERTVTLNVKKLTLTTAGTYNDKGSSLGGFAGLIKQVDTSQAADIRNTKINANTISIGETEKANASGGLVGYSASSATTITDSSVTAGTITVDGKTNAGGLIGYSKGTDLTVNYSHVTAADKLHVETTTNTAYITSAGGLIGHANESSKAEISGNTVCAKATEIQGVMAGGMAGRLAAGGSSTSTGLILQNDAVAANDKLQVTALFGTNSTSDQGFAGGLSGATYGQAYIKDCYVVGGGNEDLVKGESWVGGLIGYCMGRYYRTFNDNEGVVELFGAENKQYITILNCAASVYVKLDNPKSSNTGRAAGGLIGLLNNPENGSEIRNCYAGGRTRNGIYGMETDGISQGRFNVSVMNSNATDNAGGFIGRIYQSEKKATLTISSCYTTASVYNKTKGNTGSFIGVVEDDSKYVYEVKVGNCYSTGLVGTADASGSNDNDTSVLNGVDISGHGFIGNIDSNSTVSGSGNYWLKGVQGVSGTGSDAITMIQDELKVTGSGKEPTADSTKKDASGKVIPFLTGASTGESGTPFGDANAKANGGGSGQQHAAVYDVRLANNAIKGDDGQYSATGSLIEGSNGSPNTSFGEKYNATYPFATYSNDNGNPFVKFYQVTVTSGGSSSSGNNNGQSSSSSSRIFYTAIAASDDGTATDGTSMLAALRKMYGSANVKSVPTSGGDATIYAHIGDWPETVKVPEPKLRIVNGSKLSALLAVSENELSSYFNSDKAVTVTEGTETKKILPVSFAVRGLTSGKVAYMALQVTQSKDSNGTVTGYSVSAVSPDKTTRFKSGGTAALPAAADSTMSSWSDGAKAAWSGQVSDNFAVNKSTTDDGGYVPASGTGTLAKQPLTNYIYQAVSTSHSGDSVQYEKANTGVKSSLVSLGTLKTEFSNEELSGLAMAGDLVDSNGTAMTISTTDVKKFPAAVVGTAGSSRYQYIEIDLDDITTSGGNFAAIYDGFVPGEDVQIYAEQGEKTWNELAEDALEKGAALTTATTSANTGGVLTSSTTADILAAVNGTADSSKALSQAYSSLFDITGRTNSIFADGSNKGKAATTNTTTIGSGTAWAETAYQPYEYNLLAVARATTNKTVISGTMSDSEVMVREYNTNASVVTGKDSNGTDIKENPTIYGGKALLLNGRHLQNLENTVSGVNSSTEINNVNYSKMFTAAELHNDILWADYAGKNDSNSADYTVAQSLANAGITAFIDGSVNDENTGITITEASGSRTQIHLYANDNTDHQRSAGRFLGIVNNPGITRFDGGMFYGQKTGTDGSTGEPQYRHIIYNLSINPQKDSGNEWNAGIFARISHSRLGASFRMTSFILKDPTGIETDLSNGKPGWSSRGLLIGYIDGTNDDNTSVMMDVADKVDNISVISDKDIQVSGCAFVGGLVGAANVKSLTLEKCDFTAGTATIYADYGGSGDSKNIYAAGGLVGNMRNGSFTVTDCSVTAGTLDVKVTKKVDEYSAGGLLGYVKGSSLSITDSSVTADTIMSAGFNAGGMVGSAQADLTVTNGIVKANEKLQVTADDHAGGLVGSHGYFRRDSFQIHLNNCHVIGGGDQDEVKGGFSGGLVGAIRCGGGSSEITNCSASTYVRTNNYDPDLTGRKQSTDFHAGGLIGEICGNGLVNSGDTRNDWDDKGHYYHSSGSITISSCYVGGRTSGGKYADATGFGKPRFNVIDENTEVSGKTMWYSAGGLIGSLNRIGYPGDSTDRYITINNCFTTASVYGPKNGDGTGHHGTGSFIGDIQTANLTINDSYSTGFVKLNESTSENGDVSFIGKTSASTQVTINGSGNYWLKGVQAVSGTGSSATTVTMNDLSSVGATSGSAGTSSLSVSGASVGQASTPFADYSKMTDANGNSKDNPAQAAAVYDDTLKGSYSAADVTRKDDNDDVIAWSTLEGELTQRGLSLRKNSDNTTNVVVTDANPVSLKTSEYILEGKNESTSVAEKRVVTSTAAGNGSMYQAVYPYLLPGLMDANGNTVNQNCVRITPDRKVLAGPAASGTTDPEGTKTYYFIGDWPEPEVGSFGLIYYEKIQGDSSIYYEGYTASKADDYTETEYTYISSQNNDPSKHDQVFVKGHGKYVSEDGYILLVNAKDFDDSKTVAGFISVEQFNDEEKKQQAHFLNYSGKVTDKFVKCDDLIAQLGLTGYAGYLYKWESNYTIKPDSQGTVLGFAGYENNTQTLKACFEFLPFFSDEIKVPVKDANGEITMPEAGTYVADASSPDYGKTVYSLRNARQLKMLAENPSGYGYLLNNNNGKDNVIEQQLDITFDMTKVLFTVNGSAAGDEAYASPTINKISPTSPTKITYRSSLASSQAKDYYTLDGLTKPFINTLQGGRLEKLHITNMNALYFVNEVLYNGSSIEDVTIDKSTFTGDAAFVIKDQEAPITDCHINNSTISGAGFAKELLYQKAVVSNCSINGSTITGNGFAATNDQGIINNCSINQSTWKDSSRTSSIIGNNTGEATNFTVNGKVVNLSRKSSAKVNRLFLMAADAADLTTNSAVEEVLSTKTDQRAYEIVAETVSEDGSTSLVKLSDLNPSLSAADLKLQVTDQDSETLDATLNLNRMQTMGVMQAPALNLEQDSDAGSKVASASLTTDNKVQIDFNASGTATLTITYTYTDENGEEVTVSSPITIVTEGDTDGQEEDSVPTSVVLKQVSGDAGAGDGSASSAGTVSVGSNISLAAYDQDGNQVISSKMTWVSSDTSIASIIKDEQGGVIPNEDGSVSVVANKAGTVTISARRKNGTDVGDDVLGTFELTVTTEADTAGTQSADTGISPAGDQNGNTAGTGDGGSTADPDTSNEETPSDAATVPVTEETTTPANEETTTQEADPATTQAVDTPPVETAPGEEPAAAAATGTGASAGASTSEKEEVQAKSSVIVRDDEEDETDDSSTGSGEETVGEE